MSNIGDLVANAHAYARQFAGGELDAPPARKVAVVTCMDARIDPAAILGLELGDVHVIRNAGGTVTEDVLRSLAVSQRRLDTTEVMVVQHTSCGMLGLDEAALEAEVGERPRDGFGGFDDLDQSVREGVDRIYRSKLTLHGNDVRGFVYDVKTGRLREVT